MDHSGHGMMTELPPFTLSRGLEPSFNGFFLFACLLGLALYGWGVARLVARGDRWPVGRTVSFVVGVLTVLLVMCTRLNDYGMVMFSVHMVQHMVISMLSPILLLLGAPITLALRALPVAPRGRTGLRTGTVTRSWRRTTPTSPRCTPGGAEAAGGAAGGVTALAVRAPAGDHGGRGGLAPVQVPATGRRRPMHGSTKTMGALTVGTLVLATAYSVTLGSNGWVWFGWVILAMATVSMVAASRGA